MSRIPPNPEDESIYNLIPPPKEHTSHKKRYKSRFSSNPVPPTGSTFGLGSTAVSGFSNVGGDFQVPSNSKKTFAAGVMGRKVDKPSPKKFLKKGEKTRVEPVKSPGKFQYGDRRKPKVQTKPSPKPARPQKNFIKDNAKQAKTVGLRTKPQVEIDYRNKQEFGKVPAYLEDVKKEIEMEQDHIRVVLQQQQQQKEAMQKTRIVQLPEEQRVEILEGLQKRWDEVNKKYQGMTHMTALDTLTKIKRKEQFEHELDELEKSIDRMSRPAIYVEETLQ